MNETRHGSPALTAALEASLNALDAPSAPDASPGAAILASVDPNSLAILWNRINEKLALGLPEEVTDYDLLTMVQRYRIQRLQWDQEQQAKAPRKRSPSRSTIPTSIAEAIVEEDWSEDSSSGGAA